MHIYIYIYISYIYIRSFLLTKRDHNFIYLYYPSHSYLNFPKREIPLLNLDLANHSCDIDSNNPFCNIY